MSLKARIEAVIYAAEEPVTLTQLTALFATEIKTEPQPDGDSATPEAAPSATEAAAHDTDPEAEAETPSAPAGTSAAPETSSEEAASADGQKEAGNTPSSTEQSGEAEPSDPDAAAKAEAAAQKAEQRRQRDAIKAVVDELIADYAGDEGDSTRGMEIREVAGGYRMATKPEYHDAVRGFIKSLKPPLKLSLPALETLAVIAYKQPVTAPEIGEIRGVDSGGVLGSLLTRKLIATAGRKQVIGRPILYKTTREFLLRFGLKDVGELPSLEEFEKMAAEISDLDEGSVETAQDTLAFAQAESADSGETDGSAPEGNTTHANATRGDATPAGEAVPSPAASEGETPEPREPAIAVGTAGAEEETDSLIYSVEDEQGRP